jgi:hypothetical protein
MDTAKDRLLELGVGVPDILVPHNDVDLEKWAVVACDQYTSEEDYWKSVDAYVGDSPSTLRLIFPEAYLEEPNPENRIAGINQKMAQYVQENLFKTYSQSFFIVQRDTGHGSARWGLIVALDLEQYDYAKDSRTYIRATEGTILSRIPPRKLIRKDAPLELPHILVLISDPHRTVIEPLVAKKDQLEKVYETKLMKNGGKITAYCVQGEENLENLATAFEGLKAALDPQNPLLFAMGDGNHSLATAKSCWEDIKATLSDTEKENHPARFALVELENIFDEGLVFEPIHRVLFGISRQEFFAQLAKFCAGYSVDDVASLSELNQKLLEHGESQVFGYVDHQRIAIVSMDHPSATIAAGTLQGVIDSFLEANPKTIVDYIHGSDVTYNLGSKPGNIGLFLPSLDKNHFFDTIIQDGALPRKTFSMGEAHEKRFYMEARKIK